GYNISLTLPSGWSYSGTQYINANGSGNYSVLFNVTSGQTSANETVNATVKFVYPGLSKVRNETKQVENGGIAILDVVRETPKLIGKDTVGDAQLTIHNKGCRTSSSGAVVKEILSTGWTPANPSIKDNEYTTDYGRPVSLTSSSTDLINNIITWELGAIEANEYAVLTYQVKSPNSLSTLGNMKFNVTWDGKYLREDNAHTIQTINYTSESHLEFDLETIQQSNTPWSEPRSAQVNKSYNYSLKVVNIGDVASARNWTVNLTLPNTCNATNVLWTNGSWDETNRKISWNITNLAVYDNTHLNFTANCTSSARYTFLAEGFSNTRDNTTYINNSGLSCQGKSCNSFNSYTFSKPTNARYEKLSEVDFYIVYNFTGGNTAIAEGMVNFSDDLGINRIAWQNYSFANSNGTLWSNYSIDENEQDRFQLVSRNIGVYAYVNGTYSSLGNVTINKLAYRWETGKIFREQENLYTNVKVYNYNPLLQNATLLINGNSSVTTGGWGEEFNFTVLVRDRFSRNVTIFAWQKPSAAAEYSLIPNNTYNFTCVNCDSGFNKINFTYDYQPNTGNLTTFVFKFNSSSPDGNTELAGFSYTVEKDDIDVNVTSPLHNAVVSRNASSVFSVLAYDRDNRTYPEGANGKVYISIVGTDTFEASPTAISSSNGYINRTVTNSQWCASEAQYFLGKHGWYGGTTSDNFYKDNSTAAINFTLLGSLINSVAAPNGSTNYTRGNSISFQGSVADDCGNSRTADATINFSISRGNFISSCIAAITGACSITTTSSFPTGYYNFSMVSNKSNYYNGSIINNSLFYLGTTPTLDNLNKTPSSEIVPWGRSPFVFNVSVSDADNDTVSVYLYLRNDSGLFYIENQTTCVN
ncbi:MAG: hypothetical protein HY361_04775, partial [Candidatus Aenigmarchaeota archaeon]|nr:hypothetical protein [Candidatus Aenigmarchaeota archaeon]